MYPQTSLLSLLCRPPPLLFVLPCPQTAAPLVSAGPLPFVAAALHLLSPLGSGHNCWWLRSGSCGLFPLLLPVTLKLHVKLGSHYWPNGLTASLFPKRLPL